MIVAIALLAFLVGGGIGAIAGVKFANKADGWNRGGRGVAATQNGRSALSRGGMMGRQGYRPVNGKITEADGKSITVALNDGSSKIVLVSNKTAVNKAQNASVTDLKVGETVAVFGSENTDGSISAQSIQLNPEVRNMVGGNSSSSGGK